MATCQTCGVAIVRTASGRARTKFCSTKCSVRWQKQKIRRARWEREQPTCAQCGGRIPFTVRAGRRYCSLACRNLRNAAYQEQHAGAYNRQRTYGVTPDAFAAMLASQGGCCAICRAKAPGGKGDWHLDHDHESGANRGLLCHACNLGIGHFGDDEQLLTAAVAYLDRSAESQVIER